MISCEVTAWCMHPGVVCKRRTLVSKPFLSSAQSTDVFCRLWNFVCKQLEGDEAQGVTIDCRVQEHSVCGGGGEVGFSLGCSKLQLGTAAPAKSASAIRKRHSCHLNSDYQAVNKSLFYKWHRAFDKRNLLPFSLHKRGPHPETRPSRQVLSNRQVEV